MAVTGGSGDVESPACSSSGEDAVSADAGEGKAESGVEAVVVSLRNQDYHAASNLWRNVPDGWDKFREFGEDRWIVRPPAALLKFGLEALSPGLDGWVIQRLNVLTDELIACGNEEETMVDVCQEMRELLLQVLRAVDYVNELASSESLTEAQECTMLIVIWAFTWVETLLLEHAMVRDCSPEEMQTISSRWETLHFCWPQELERTKRALDILRRVALLSCGQQAEAVEDFEAPDYWIGFEACFLCVVTSMMNNPGLRKPGRICHGCADVTQIGNRCLNWIQRAERAVPRNHEHWPLVRARVLMWQQTYFRQFGRIELSRQVDRNTLDLIEQIDLQPRFDFPVPLPKIEFLKLELLEYLAHNRSTGWQPNELVPGIGPEVMDRLDVVQSFLQARYACFCLLLRGDQLITHFGQVEEGLEAFDRCLSKLTSFVHKPWLEKKIFETCHGIMARDIASMAHLDRVEKLQAFVVAHGKSLELTVHAHFFIRNALAVCGFSGPATFMPSLVPVLSPSKTVLEAFWESYKDSCAALSLYSANERRYEVKLLGNGNKLQVFAGSWTPYFCLFHIHAVAATVSKLLAPIAEAGDGEIARKALLSLESARNYKSEDFGPHIDWDWIKRAHRACGPGAVFVQFAGLTSTFPLSLGMLDVCIVVQDEGVASCHRFDRIDSDSVLENVREISDACLERKLENDSCKKSLETLYNLLIRPLFNNFIRDQNRNPHRKLVISAVGCFQDVPFSILRNTDSGCYLFEEVKLAFTPSFLMLDSCQLRYESLQERTLLAGAGAAVALGDPQYLPYQECPLPGSRKEVDAICELFEFCRPEHEVVKLLGADATVERLLEWVKKPSGVGSGTQCHCSQAFIHIAAHGSGGKETDHGTLRLASATTQTRRRRRAALGKLRVERDDQPTFSDEDSYAEPEAAVPSDMDAFLFGHQMLQQEADRAAEGLDFLSGLLPLRSSDAGSSLHCDDIMLSGWEWCAYMVVLSACSTAVGVTLHYNALDVLSFSRAFMTAGVPCSVLAQWRVDDSAALHIMSLFYEALSQGEDVCSALQSAMMKMHQTGKHTLHQLAPFVVTGLPTVCLPPQMRRCQAALKLASSIELQT